MGPEQVIAWGGQGSQGRGSHQQHHGWEAGSIKRNSNNSQQGCGTIRHGSYPDGVGGSLRIGVSRRYRAAELPDYTRKDVSAMNSLQNGPGPMPSSRTTP